MSDNAAKVVNFEQFRASRTTAAASMASDSQNAMAGFPAFCFVYWTCQPVMFWNPVSA